jgi:lysophospholipase L1-like esterase
MRPQFHRGWFATWCVLFFLGTRFSAAAQSNAAHLKFQFGAGNPATGTSLVGPEMIYSAERGFGFERGADLKANDHGGVASDKGFFFSAAVPEGSYRVTVTLGGSSAVSETTVNAELRRLMLERVRSDPGKTETRSFIVNVRRSAIAGGREVRLTPREKTSETWAWDDRLTLEFLGTHPAVVALEIEPVEVPTVFLIGDSTVCDQSKEPFNSWGQMITRFFKPVVAVANHAESGESIAGALGKGRFDKIWSQIRKGDYLFVQFGHNDMKSTATNALETYTADLRRIVDEARKRGATPVLCTSVSRRTFNDEGKITNSFRGYTDAVRLVAKEKNVPLIDLQAMGAAFYESMGPDGSHRAFANLRENTHHNDYGSYEIAQCVLQGIRQNKLELAADIVTDFKGFDPSHPDPIENFKVPASSDVTSETPAGN